MRIHILRQMGYEGTQIYVMHFDNIFQYLFSWRNEIFQNHIVLKVKLWRQVAAMLKLLPLYTLEDLEGGEQVMLNAAMDSIDKLKTMKIKRAKVAKSDRKCMWRVRVSEAGDTLYECLYHGVEVPFVEGVIPKHKVNG